MHTTLSLDNTWILGGGTGGTGGTWGGKCTGSGKRESAKMEGSRENKKLIQGHNILQAKMTS